MRASDNLNAWRVLVALGRGGGIRRASIETGLDSPQCTRLLQALEDDLSLSLVLHGSRPVSLSQAGEALADDAGRLLECADRLRLRAEGLARSAATFVFSIPSNTPRESSFRIIKRFLGAHPGLSLMMASDADHETVLEGGVDAAYLAYVPEPLPNLRVLPLGPIGNVPVASPDYVARSSARRSSSGAWLGKATRSRDARPHSRARASRSTCRSRSCRMRLPRAGSCPCLLAGIARSGGLRSFSGRTIRSLSASNALRAAFMTRSSARSTSGKRSS